MNDAREVRDLLARTAYDAEWEGSIDDVGEIERAMAYQIADAQLRALSEAGLTVCGEQVGTQDRDGFLHEMRQQVEGRPVFIQAEEPK